MMKVMKLFSKTVFFLGSSLLIFPTAMPAQNQVVDEAFVGNVSEFSGVGHGMLVSAGKHRVKIALHGYQAFETEVSLLAHQKITIKTDLVPTSVSQAGASVKP